MHILHSRIVAWSSLISGCVGLVLAIFLYEDEQYRLQSRLETLWVQIDDLRSRLVKRHIAAVRVAFLAVQRVLDRMLGTRLLSWRAIAVLASFSIASIWWGDMLGFRILQHMVRHGFVLVAGVCVITAVVTLLPWYRPHLWPIVAIVAVVIAFDVMGSFGSLINLWTHQGLATFIYGLFAIGLLLGAALNVIFIAILRRIVVRGTDSRRTVDVVTALAASAAIALVVFRGRSLLQPYTESLRWNEALYQTELGTYIANLTPIVTRAGQAVMVSGFLSLMVFVLLALLMVHRALWPLLCRPLYASARFGLFRDPKLLGGFSLSLLVYGIAAIAG